MQDLTAKDLIDNSFQWKNNFDEFLDFIGPVHGFKYIRYDCLKTTRTMDTLKRSIIKLSEFMPILLGPHLCIDTKDGLTTTVHVGDWIFSHDEDPRAFTVLTDAEFKTWDLLI